MITAQGAEISHFSQKDPDLRLKIFYAPLAQFWLWA